MQSQKSHFLFYGVILLSLFVALSPAILSNNYLRQDDLMWEIWPRMKISDFGYLYYNTVFQLVRPVCMLSFYLTDLISLNLHQSVYVRLICVLFIGVLGLFLYRWQLFFNSNRLLAATFAISAFTLPAYQLFAATANYSLIISALFLTFCALFFWYCSFNAAAEKLKKRYLFIGCILFYVGLLDYPLSSMYGWTLLSICYLNSFILAHPKLTPKKKFFFYIAKLILLMMVAYFITIIVVHLLFHVNLQYGNRPGTLETAHLLSRFLWIFDTLSAHSALWLWGNSHFESPLPLIAICVIFLVALIYTNITSHIHSMPLIAKNSIQSIASLFILFFMAYSPVLATSEHAITFRYTLATMPLLLYIIFWSINQLSLSPPSRNILFGIPKIVGSFCFIFIALFGIGYANWMMADGIVGPHENDFRHVQQQLTKKVIPLLRQGKKVLIHAIDCDNGKNYHYANNVPTAYEYGMRTCQFQQQVIGVILHSLMMMGYPSNYHQHNSVIYKENEIEVTDIPWGKLIVNSNEHLSRSQRTNSTITLPVVTIDTREIPPYNRFDFYKNFLKKYK